MNIQEVEEIIGKADWEKIRYGVIPERIELVKGLVQMGTDLSDEELSKDFTDRNPGHLTLAGYMLFLLKHLLRDDYYLDEGQMCDTEIDSDYFYFLVEKSGHSLEHIVDVLERLRRMEMRRAIEQRSPHHFIAHL